MGKIGEGEVAGEKKTLFASLFSKESNVAPWLKAKNVHTVTRELLLLKA